MTDLLDLVANFSKATNLFDLLPDDSDGNTEEFLKNVAAKARPTPEEEKKKKKNKRKQEAKKKAAAAKKKQILMNNNPVVPSVPTSIHRSPIDQPVNGQANILQSYQRNHRQGHSQASRFQGNQRNNTGGDFCRRKDEGASQNYLMRNNKAPVNGQANILQSYQRNHGQGHSQVDRFQGLPRNNTGGDFYRRNDGGASHSCLTRNNGWDHGQGRAHVHVNGANKSLEEEVDKTMTYQEYEKGRLEKKKALESHPEKSNKVSLDEDFKSMKLIGKKGKPEFDELLYKPAASESGRPFRGAS